MINDTIFVTTKFQIKESGAPRTETKVQPQVFKKSFEELSKTLEKVSLSKLITSISRFSRFTKNKDKLLTHELVGHINHSTEQIWKRKLEIKKALKQGMTPHADNQSKARTIIEEHLIELNKHMQEIKEKHKELSKHKLQPYIPKEINKKIEHVQNLVDELNKCGRSLGIHLGTTKKGEITRLPPPPKISKGIPQKKMPPPPSFVTEASPKKSDKPTRPPRTLPTTPPTTATVKKEAPPLPPRRAPQPTPLPTATTVRREVPLPPRPAPKTEGPKAKVEESNLKASKVENNLKEWQAVSTATIRQLREFAAQIGLTNQIELLNKYKLTDLWDAFQELTNKQSEFNDKLATALKGCKTTEEKLEKFTEVVTSDACKELIKALSEYVKEFTLKEKDRLAYKTETTEAGVFVTQKEGWTSDDYFIKPVQALSKYPLLMMPLIEASPGKAERLATIKNEIYNQIMELNKQIGIEKQKGLQGKSKSKKKI